VTDDLRFELGDACGDRTTMTVQLPNCLPRFCWESIIDLDCRHEPFEFADPFGNRKTELGRQPAYGIRNHRLLLDQQRPCRVQGQHTLLLPSFDEHEFHIRAGCGRAERRRISSIVLLALLDERPGCLRRH